MNAQETLVLLIKLFTNNLNELAEENVKNEFVHGEMTAYVECLEIIKGWKNSEKFGLNYTVADKYGI